ncbi:hypothetical protein [Proteiniborus sp.]|uniref:hypothetical protein n=1 Tax=Proteiniborus sp. TaxID=2079015 RepID=UPI003333E47A
MFNLKKNTALRVLIILAITILATTACTKNPEKPNIEKKEEKVPEKLKAMQGKNEDIIKEIEKIVEEMKKPEEPKKPEEKAQQQQQGQGDGGGGSQGGGGGGSQGGGGSDSEGGSGQDQQKTSEKTGGEKKPETKQEKIDTMWKAVKKTSEDLHTSWGDYEIIAIEKGVKKQELSKFEDTINNLTVAVEDKNIINSLFYSNEVTYNMAPFFDAYKDNREGELMRIKYFTRQAHLHGGTGDWDKSEESIRQAEEAMNIARARIKLNKEDQQLMEKLNISLTNMKTSIPMKNVELIKIKRDIVLKNVDEIRDKL